MAKSAPRIDFVFQHNCGGQRICYYVEAKNMIEYDYTKAGCKKPTRVSKIQKRYIETGMDHFLSTYYPIGCLLGYVLNGTIDDVVNAINILLSKAGRNAEVLKNASGTESWMNY